MSNLLFKQAEHIALTRQIVGDGSTGGRFGTNKLGQHCPVVYGQVEHTPPVLSQQIARNANYANTDFGIIRRAVPEQAWVVIYGLSHGKSYGEYSGTKDGYYWYQTRNYVDRFFIDGEWQNTINLRIYEDSSSRIAYDIGDNYAKRGEKDTYIGARVGNTTTRGQYIAQYVRAGFYTGSERPELSAVYNIDWHDENMDYLIVAYDYLTRLTDESGNTRIEALQSPPKFSCIYNRGLLAPGSDQWEDSTIGNCLMDYLTADTYGFALDRSTDINVSSFQSASDFGFGSKYGVILDSEQPLQDNLNQLIAPVKVFITKHSGQYHMTGERTQASADFTVNGDSILGGIDIIYPSAEDRSSSLIGTYHSYEDGERQLITGTVTTNTQSVDLYPFSDFDSAKFVLEAMYRTQRSQRTFTFTMDRAAHKITVGDLLAVSLDIPDLTNVFMRVVKKTLNDDYTFDMECVEHDNDYYSQPAPFTTKVGDAKKLIKAPGGWYRPPLSEPPIAEDPPEPVIQPGPIIVTPPSLISISGAQYPVNLITGDDVTDWYLGSTEDGSTLSSEYDSNGCQVRLEQVNEGSGSVWVIRTSLIWRRTDTPPPDYIMYAVGVARTQDERNSRYVGQALTKDASSFTLIKFNNFLQQPTDDKGIQYVKGAGGFGNWRTLNNIFPNRNAVKIYTGEKAQDSDNPSAYNGTFESPADQNFVRSLFRFVEERVGTTQSNAFLNTLTANSQLQTGDLAPSGAVDAWEIHFTAHWGDYAEYIGSTRTWANGKSVLTQHRAEAESNWEATTNTAWPTTLFTYTSPPTRSKS